MKTTLLALFLGLLLAGCTKTSTSSTKDVSASEPNPGASSTASADKSATTSSAASTAVAANAADTSPPPSVSVTIPPPAPSAEATPAEAAPADAMPAAADATPSAAADVTPVPNNPTLRPSTTEAFARAERIHEWNLRPEDIVDELKNSDRIERTKEPEAGAPTGPIDSGRVTDVIAAKFKADLEMGSFNFGVMVVDDVATLTGTARSPGQIGRAMALALDTDGVSKVVSRIKLDLGPPPSP